MKKSPSNRARAPGRPKQPQHDPNLGVRLERFRSALGAAGGPVEALELGRAGLDDLWRWFLENHPSPNSPRSYDQAELLGAGPLPAWYPRKRDVAGRLGPDLVQLADGLAAHVTSIVLATEPSADWVVEKDMYIKGQVPKLRLPGRRPAAIDDAIVNFIWYMHNEQTFYLPNDPMEFVDSFLDFGDPRPRVYEMQTAKEARALIEHVSAGLDARRRSG